jgi:hypothetical protein
MFDDLDQRFRRRSIWADEVSQHSDQLDTDLELAEKLDRAWLHQVTGTANIELVILTRAEARQRFPESMVSPDMFFEVIIKPDRYIAIIYPRFRQVSSKMPSPWSPHVHEELRKVARFIWEKEGAPDAPSTSGHTT